MGEVSEFGVSNGKWLEILEATIFRTYDFIILAL